MIDLEKIKDPSFIKDLSIKELKALAKQIREFLIENISNTGGHLSSNLGIVELTIALYYVFDPEKDEFLFDVGHQSYVHKILTGRAKDFKTLRQFGGLSGYISKSESKYDIWESGHSSTTISAMSGLMLANDDNDKKIISIIGDSSIVNGVALEGLNFLGQIKGKNSIVILNDNKMGISKSVGALSKVFSKLRRGKFFRAIKTGLNKILPAFISRFFHQIKRGIKGFIQQDNIFEDLGFDYYGPYDGNDLKYCIKVLQKIKKTNEPLVIHFQTKKGKGYIHSEEDAHGNYHGVPPFNIETGKPKNVNSELSYSQIVSDYLLNKRKEQEFYVVNPAMKSGANLDEFARLYPNNFFDVGIAEEHAAVMSAGIALREKNVFLLMYSTFSQRAYDQILNDIARNDLKVIFGIDRAGIVGEDGSTHQGLYDVSMFMAMPNIVVTMPKDGNEAIGLLNYALNVEKHPIVIRYPRGISDLTKIDDYSYQCDLSWDILNDGNKCIAIGYGNDIARIDRIVKEKNLDVMVVNAKSLKPIDLNMLHKIFNKNIPIIIFEQIISSGTLYHKCLEFKEENNYTSKVIKHSFDSDTIIPHGSIKDVYNNYGLSDSALENKIKEVLGND